MSDETQIEEGDQGLTRREMLRKGAFLGGALAWSIPAVQTFQMAPAFAAATSYAISYVAVVARCNGQYFRGKYEVNDDGSPANSGNNGWEFGNGSLPCEGSSKEEWPNWPYENGGPPSGFPPDTDPNERELFFDFGVHDCEVIWTLNKCGPTCIVTEYVSPDNPTATGPSSVGFEPCPAS